MRNILAVARLTFAEGIRMRIVLVFVLVLLFILLRLPFTLRGDETLAGRLQTFLSYALGAVNVLLGIACVFFSCATLTTELRTRTLHLVVTKPVSRFAILAGKWLGINALLGLLVVLCGLAIYGFALFIKARPATFERDKISVRDVVWQARVAATPTPPADVRARAEEWVASQLKQGREFARGPEYAVAERTRQLLLEWRLLRPNEGRLYLFENLIPPRTAQAAIQVRYRARGIPIPPLELLPLGFRFVDPQTRAPLSEWRAVSERSGDLHSFLVIGQAVIKDGQACLAVANTAPPQSGIAVHLDQDDWLQIFYTVGTFGENYVKALALTVARLAFLSAVGLFFSVFVSFPVACLCAFTFYLVCLGMPFWMESVGANLEIRTEAIDPFGAYGPAVRAVLVPVMKVVFPDFPGYDGTPKLVAGEYIPYGLLLRAVGHTVVYGLLLLFVPGWLIFRGREIAEVIV